jgi:2-oxoisovalerate dehydrogenase E1 component alpha subunit
MSSKTNNAKPDDGAHQIDKGMTHVARFDIFCRQYIAPEGSVVADLPKVANDLDLLKTLYRQMVLTRVFDQKAIALQRTGRLGTYASVLGQEAIGTGVASAMCEDDVLLPSFREHGAQLRRGVTIRELLLYWGGDERGSDFSGPRHDFPVCIPVGSHFPHAAGAALAMKLRGSNNVAVVIAGDGATSKGEFYEALNVAGVWQLPLLVVIANNQWAISVSRKEQTRARTLAQKAIAAGIPGEQVDGNDAVAVYTATLEALEAIRAGQGPRLIEAMTYRLGDHTTADNASRYRDDEEVSRHWQEDPVSRLRDYLTAQNFWTKEDEQSLLEECRGQVETEADAYLATPVQAVSTMFDHLFDVLPDSLKSQRDDAIEAGHGEQNG